jgi:hypothetical protein
LRPNSVGPLKPTGDKDLKRGRILLANFWPMNCLFQVQRQSLYAFAIQSSQAWG